MFDPDATGGNFETQVGLHTIQGNYTCASPVMDTTVHILSSATEPLAPFIPPEPQPQPQAVTHRYTLTLFQQPAEFVVPAAFEYALPLDLENVTNRLNFDIRAFASVTNIPLIAANYFDIISPAEINATGSASTATITSWQATGVPSTSSSSSAAVTQIPRSCWGFWNVGLKLLVSGLMMLL